MLTLASCIVGFRISLPLFCCSLYLFFFSFSPFFSSKMSLQLYNTESLYFVYRLTLTSCIVGWRTHLLLFVLPVYVHFFLSPCIQYCKFLTKISLQPFKIENYLVYRLTMASCIVGLRMSLLPFVLPSICSFLFCSFLVKYISTAV